MAVLTLVEAAKLMEPSRETGVVDIFASSYQPMTVAPVISTEGKSAYQWTIGSALSHTTGGKRNVGSDYTASAGRVTPYESEVKIYGGIIQVDDYIAYHSPASVRSQENLQIQSFAYELTKDIFEGDGGTSLRGFRHWMLNDPAYMGQEVSAGATASGVLMTLDKVDEMIEHVDRTPATYLYTNEIGARYLKKLSRGNATDQQRIEYGKDEFGMWSWKYDGIPVVVIRDGAGANILSTTEIDGATSASDTYSMYCVAWGTESAALFSSGPLLGPGGVPVPKVELQSAGTNYKYERFEWYAGLAPKKPRSIARLKHIKNTMS